jgi:uncharacterized peroxidase-related enzyme
MTADAELDLPKIDLDIAGAEARPVLEKAKAQVGFVPNMYAGMANQPALLETYLDGYARFREQAGFTPPEQEVVFLTISRANGCGYCIAAHSMIGEKKSGVPAEVLSALREGRPIPDAKLAALAAFTETMVERRGLPKQADVDALRAAGYTDAHVLGIILAIGVKTFSNYANHLMHNEVDEVFAGQALEAAE